MESRNFLQLLDKYLNGTASREEVRLLEEYYRRLDENSEKGLSEEEEEGLYGEMLKNIRKEIHKVPPLNRRSPVKRMRIIGYAAAFIAAVVLLSAGIIFLGRQQPKERVAVHKQLKKIVPGGNKAVLILSNGAAVALDTVHPGQLTSQGNSNVIKLNTGLLAYKTGKQKLSKGSPVLYNTLVTPRGGQYQLGLSDGSKVWLNSASSIRYPTVFTGEERKVAITGEAYIEVAEDARHPFIVTTRNSNITVLGTHFNVMAYDDEPAVKATLLEGSVKVSIPGSKKAMIIKPGQQAIVTNKRENIKVRKVNAAEVAAWIHGILSLNDCSVHEFMNQLSRWYDVDIQYVDGVPDERFGGTINRNAQLSDVLSALDAIGIHTRLKGKKVIVLSH